MIPSNIREEHVKKALMEIDEHGVPKGRNSRKFIIEFDGKNYPPKYVLALANNYANGIILDSEAFGGGNETNQFLRALGFQILGKNQIEVERKLKSRKTSKNKAKKHNERCKECKEKVYKMLQEIFGEVKRDYDLDLPSKLEAFENISKFKVLSSIYKSLEDYRGFRDFVKANKLANVDFFIQDPGLIVEFDESQHFTIPRKIALENYPEEIELGFDKKKWISLCESISAKDNDPIYRDEQRAWYDTIRDFGPLLKDLNPTIRLFASDYEWCSLDPNNLDDIEKFRNLLNLNSKIPIIGLNSNNPSFSRIIIAKGWIGEPKEAKKILEAISKIWPKDTKVKFILTWGAFLRFNWPESIKREDIGDNKNPNNEVVDVLVAEAEKCVKYLLKGGIKDQLMEYADYITIGIDSFSKDPATPNYTSYPHIELVFLVDLKNDEYYWTGKSYPTLGQERGLVRIPDLNKHIFDLKVGKTLIFCCHDLNIYNPRSITAKGWRKEVNKEFKELVENENPSIALHHPHSTIKFRTWLNPWKNLIRLNPSITEYAGNGMYFEIGKQPDELEKVLDGTKMGNSIDFIIE